MINCMKCEAWEYCRNKDKFQRENRDFSVLSGRCPKLPNTSFEPDVDWLEKWKQEQGL